jgi:hypothetical protein
MTADIGIYLSSSRAVLLPYSVENYLEIFVLISVNQTSCAANDQNQINQ